MVIRWHVLWALEGDLELGRIFHHLITSGTTSQQFSDVLLDGRYLIDLTQSCNGDGYYIMRLVMDVHDNCVSE